MTAAERPCQSAAPTRCRLTCWLRVSPCQEGFDPGLRSRRSARPGGAALPAWPRYGGPGPLHGTARHGGGTVADLDIPGRHGSPVARPASLTRSAAGPYFPVSSLHVPHGGSVRAGRGPRASTRVASTSLNRVATTAGEPARLRLPAESAGQWVFKSVSDCSELGASRAGPARVDSETGTAGSLPQGRRVASGAESGHRVGGDATTQMTGA